MATQPHTLVTAEHFHQLPQEEGREFELLDGEVIELPSATPGHNLIVSNLIGLLGPGLRGRAKAIPFTDFSDGHFTTLRPDLVILFNDKFALLDLDKLPVTIPPDIVIEVISASESYSRVNRRINAYRRFGVQEVWIFDYQNLQMNLHGAAGAKRLCSGDALESPLLPGWSVPIDQIFEQ
jgi:Uma2 family endonuclease